MSLIFALLFVVIIGLLFIVPIVLELQKTVKKNRDSIQQNRYDIDKLKEVK